MKSRCALFSVALLFAALAAYLFFYDLSDDAISEAHRSIEEVLILSEGVNLEADSDWSQTLGDTDSRNETQLSVAAKRRVFNQLLNRIEGKRSVEEEPALLDVARYGFRESLGRAGGGEFRAQNLLHDFEVEANVSGISIRENYSYPGDLNVRGESQLELKLTGVRQGDANVVLSNEPFRSDRSEERLVRRHGSGVVEWWQNDLKGLEHGYVIERPLGHGVEGEELRIDLSVSSRFEMGLEGEEIVFRDESGARAMTYDSLLVSDANGRVLPAKIELGLAELRSHERNALAVSLVVDMKGAAYPVLVDPTISSQLLLDLSGWYQMPDNGACVLGNSILFPAFSGGTGFELWISDGTEAGTRLLKDINPGRAGSFPREFVSVGAKVYFLAWTPEFGEELWCSDGTDEGTVMLLDANVGVGSGYYGEFAGFKGRLYFNARVEGGDSYDDGELWSSDGTPEGTKQLADLYPGEYGGRPYGFTESGGKLFFAAYTFDEENGAGAPLWVLEQSGSEVAIRKLGQYSELGVVESIVPFEGGVVFSASLLAGGEVKGQELWKSDGTEAGTILLKDINLGSGGSFPSEFTLFQGKLIFAADDGFEYGRELWVSDGTAEGTKMVKNIADGDVGSGPTSLVAASEYVYFRALYGSTDWTRGLGGGLELWRTNGTEEGTALVADIVPGVESSYPSELTFAGGRLFFSAGDEDGIDGPGRELWVTEGDGASLVKDIVPGIGSSYAKFLAEIGGELYFMAQQYGEGIDASWEVWRSDGSSNGTAPLSDTVPELERAIYNGSVYQREDGDSYVFFGVPGVGSSLWLYVEDSGAFEEVSKLQLQAAAGSSPRLLARLGNEILFSAFRAGLGTELWKTDGTPAGTELVRDIYPGPEGGIPLNGVVFGESVYFQAETIDGTNKLGRELWKTDGTGAGTVLVKDINAGIGSSEPQELVVFGNAVYFSAEGDGVGREPWKTDGSAEGTVMVKDLYSGSGGSDPLSFTVLGEALYFTGKGYDGVVSTGRELWKTDATNAGTVMVRDIRMGEGDSGPLYLTRLGDELFFSAHGFDGLESTGVELWKTDGTEAGTVLVKDISLGELSSYPRFLTAMGDTLFFSAYVFDGSRNRGVDLWKSDGTAEGTVVIREILPGGYYISPESFYVMDGLLFFRASGYLNGSFTGTELWRTDGTREGTFMLRDLYPGAQSSYPYTLAALNGELYFSADGFSNGERVGRELWKTNGTPEGTVLVEDLSYSNFGSAPEFLGLMGDYLYFVADNGQHGVQIRVLDTSPRQELPAIWIESMNAEQGGIVVRIASTVGWNYLLQREPSVLSGFWIDVGLDQRGDGETLEFRVADPAAQGTEFYRMVAFPSPVNLESLGGQE